MAGTLRNDINTYFSGFENSTGNTTYRVTPYLHIYGYDLRDIDSNNTGFLQYLITCIERISPWAVSIIWNFQSDLGHRSPQVSNEYLQAAWTSLVESLLQDRASTERSVPVLFLYQWCLFTENSTSDFVQISADKNGERNTTMRKIHLSNPQYYRWIYNCKLKTFFGFLKWKINRMILIFYLRDYWSGWCKKFISVQFSRIWNSQLSCKVMRHNNIIYADSYWNSQWNHNFLDKYYFKY